MAKGTKELKTRITGVKNIQQITGAMEMVATQKLKRLQMRAEAARPFSGKIQEMVGRLSGAVSADLSPLLGARDVVTTANLVVSSDKGMCGGYNANIVRMVQALLAEAKTEQRLYVLGNKGDILLRARGRTIHRKYDDVVEKLDFTRVRGIAHELSKAFLDGDVDEVRIVFTAFLSAARQRPTAVTILPIRPEELLAEGAEAAPDEAVASADFIIEPSPEQLLRDLLPKFIEVKIYAAILQALASEFTFRRNAMKQATDAADDMIKALRRQYNRARQESITSQLLEVSSGAEALK
ncbi:MAG: ATP synthase F1 subunit gamma [Planctomycetes bacterium]|nr:ATP synthase F1 subunit gamma [Planctomycetota bacterium]